MEIGKGIRNFVVLVAILVVMMPGVMANNVPSYGDSIVVDGNSGEWIDADFFADMYNAAESNPDASNYELLSKLYLRYDCTSETLYAMVLLNDPSNHVINDINPDDNFIKLNQNKKLVDAHDVGTDGAPDFQYIINDNNIIGWEASAELSAGLYTDFSAHTQVNTQDENGQTSAVAYRAIPLVIDCDSIPIPEFPTVALPVAAILGLMFLFGRKRDS